VFVPSPGHTRRRKNTNALNLVNGMLSGMLQTLADSILHPIFLLAAVALLLNGSPYQIAAFTVIALGSWTISAVIVARLQRTLRYAYPVVIGMSVIRLLAVAFLAFTAFRSPNHDPEDVIRSLLVGFLVYQVSSAVIGQASVVTVVGTPPTARRGIVFRQRAIMCAMIAVIGGAVVWSVYRSEDDIRDGLGVLLILAALATAAATWFILSVPGGKSGGFLGDSALQLPGGLFRSLGSGAYRRFLLFRIALGLASAADPFIIVFGFREIGLELEDIGLAVVAFAIGQFAGVVIWPVWSDRQSPRGLLQITALLRVLVLVVTVAIPAISTSTLYADRFSSPDAAVRLFLSLFALLGLAVSAHATANQRYLLDISAPGSTHQTVATTNVVHGLLAFTPFAAAYLIDRISLEETLWIAAATAFVALLISGSLVESRVQVRRRIGIWNQQRRLSMR
jgi:hypothetical protein